MPDLASAINVLNAPQISKAYAENTVLPMLQKISERLATEGIQTKCKVGTSDKMATCMLNLVDKGVLYIEVDSIAKRLTLRTWDGEDTLCPFEDFTEALLESRVAEGLLISDKIKHFPPKISTSLNGKW